MHKKFLFLWPLLSSEQAARGFQKWVWVNIKPGYAPQMLLHVSIYRSLRQAIWEFRIFFLTRQVSLGVFCFVFSPAPNRPRRPTFGAKAPSFLGEILPWAFFFFFFDFAWLVLRGVNITIGHMEGSDRCARARIQPPAAGFSHCFHLPGQVTLSDMSNRGWFFSKTWWLPAIRFLSFLDPFS